MYVFLDYDVLERKFEVSHYFHHESQAREMFYERRKPYRLVLNVPDKYYDCWDWLNEHSIPNPFAFDDLIEKGVYVVLYYVNDKQKDCFRADCYKSKEYVKYLAYEPVRKFKSTIWKVVPYREETHFYKKIIIKIPDDYKEALI